jgi:hypothetical protein
VEWASVADMRQEVGESFKESFRYCYASCGHELQTEEQHRVHALMQRLEKYRQEAITAQDEEAANAAFVTLCIVEGLLNHLQLWLLVKADRMEEAWDQVVEAQDSVQIALRFVQSELLQHWYMELLALEKLLFPPQQFVSSSHTFGYAECSICGKIYGECEHVAGRLYMGRMCGKRIKEIGAVDHVAIVDHPRDKGCRWTRVKRDGYMYCTLTHRQLEEAGDDRGNVEACLLRAR